MYAGCAARCRPASACQWWRHSVEVELRILRVRIRVRTALQCIWQVFSDLAFRWGQDRVSREVFPAPILPAPQDFVNIVGACLRITTCKS
eukprot:364633-Chlamydomonas_euryale.AAC.1